MVEQVTVNHCVVGSIPILDDSKYLPDVHLALYNIYIYMLYILYIIYNIIIIIIY
jgi:hypothetical protein